MWRGMKGARRHAASRRGVRARSKRRWVASVDGECSSQIGSQRRQQAPRRMLLNATVIQKTRRNEAFAVLCRSRLCAIRAPGQPPTMASMCNVSSGVRRRRCVAADLSSAYAANVTTLAAKYSATMPIGILPAKAAAATNPINAAAMAIARNPAGVNLPHGGAERRRRRVRPVGELSSPGARRR